MAKQINWTTLRSDYFAENMRQDKQQPFSLKKLSVRWKVAYKTVRNKASIEQWNEELQEKIAEQQACIINRVQTVQIETEIEIRQRQANTARFLQDKALRKLATISSDDLTTREAIELAKLGLGEERKALGLADRYEVSHSVEIDDSPTVADQIARHQLGGALVGKLLTYLEQTDSIQGNCN